MFNAIVGKPHWPRETMIQDMIFKLEIVLPTKEGEEEPEEDDETLLEEATESEVETDDEVVEDVESKDALHTGV